MRGLVIGIAKIKVYYCKIYQDGNLVADFIPVGNGFLNTLTYTIVTGSGTYIQGPSIARAVKKMYFGVGNVAKKIIKGYIGDTNGVAKQFYPYTEVVEFTSRSVIPSSWTTGLASASATNSYGTWSCSCSKSPYAGGTGSDTTHSVGKAFDSSLDTSCTISRATSGTNTVSFYLTCPSGVKIKPTQFITNTNGYKTVDGIYGYINSSSATKLINSYDITPSEGGDSISSTTSTSNYFNEFEFEIHDRSSSSSSYNGIDVYLFTVSKGTLMKEYL